ncbi:hypothetical protein Ct61P_08581 [Colletotrichum tofieldiae]|nr:hypothetical protein Ct61P_08581 [Colletotrichum tofieldiae]
MAASKGKYMLLTPSRIKDKNFVHSTSLEDENRSPEKRHNGVIYEFAVGKVQIVKDTTWDFSGLLRN